ncbi:Mannan endo-1,6-alpha-mannosidase DFG5 [Pseudocercospora fuligena]|uniref:Mannan endo-1,6-alpha-mannosidase DFG5 n=1 Tax=Pseudocercospora fuligena TaxID=685502 RepID=A0A8H6VBV9_9PEZI|nr:Mannan endo-1,6-alpha-mannosidase DFG5 [Pseudocercospora fuligena]
MLALRLSKGATFAGLMVLAMSSPTKRALSMSDAQNAYAQLQDWYSSSTGLWQGAGWWQCANVLTTISNLAMMNDQIKDNVLAAQQTTFTSARQEDDQFIGQRFINNYYDDEGWWALGWIASYDVSGNPQYLAMAESIFADMRTTFGKTNCSRNRGGTGGIFWNRDQTYVNAVANELFFSVAAALSNRVSGKDYLNIAQQQWAWFQGSGMINSDGNINDGLTGDCRNNGDTVWSYNQGVVLGGLVELSRATRDGSHISSAHHIADAAIGLLAPAGILQEQCEQNGRTCDRDQVQFKGIFARNLMYLHRAAPSGNYASFLSNNANSILTRNTNDGKFGLRWTGPFVAPANASTHSSGMDCLIASLST